LLAENCLLPRFDEGLLTRKLPLRIRFSEAESDPTETPVTANSALSAKSHRSSARNISLCLGPILRIRINKFSGRLASGRT